MKTNPSSRAWGAAVGLWVAAAFAASAVPSAMARNIQPDEFQALSPLCQAVFGQGPRKERLAPFAALLTGSCGIGHTCNGELASLRYARLALKPGPSSDANARARFELRRRGLIQQAVSEYSYEIRCAPPTYPLLPMILTARGKALSAQGQFKAAMTDFARALELDPGNEAAQQAMTAAQIRAVAPKPAR